MNKINKQKISWRKFFRTASILTIIAVFTANIVYGSSVVQYKMIAVNDAGSKDSQFFEYDESTDSYSTIGPEYDNYDIEASDIHPQTGKLYAISGGDGTSPVSGMLYEVDKSTGALSPIGKINVISGGEIVSASFDNSGSLWVFQENVGLWKVNVANAEAEFVWQVDGVGIGDNWEGLAWNLSNTYLYASNGSKLYRYNPAEKKAELACDNLPYPTEALEFRPDGQLVGGWHSPTSPSMSVFYIDENSCDITPAGYNMPFQDIETLTYDLSYTDPCAGNNKPEPVIDASSLLGYVGDKFNFSASNSTDPDGDSLEYYWYVDGEPTTYTGVDFEYTPTSAGTYTIVLTVKDSCSYEETSVSIEVMDKPVEKCVLEIEKGADKTYVQGSGEEINYYINFENTGNADCTDVELKDFYDSQIKYISSDIDPDSDDDVWYFGTVKPNERKTVLIKTETLDTVSDGDKITNKACVWSNELGDKSDSGNWVCDSVDVYVENNPPDPCAGNNAPKAVIDPDNLSISLGADAVFSGAGSSDPDGDTLSYSWEVLGTPYTGTGQDFTYTPTGGGEYTVRLTVSDQCDLTSAEAKVKVDSPKPPKPCAGNRKPDIIVNDDIIVNLGDVFSLDGSQTTDKDGDVLSFNWAIDDLGVYFTKATGTATATKVGVFDAVLTVSDSCSEVKDNVKIVVENIEEPPIIEPPVVLPPQVKGIVTEEFVPPKQTPRAGSGLPIVEFVAGAVLGLFISIRYYLKNRVKQYI